MSLREFAQWQVFDILSPIGDGRCHDLGPALIRHTTVAINSGSNSRQPELNEFLPYTFKRRNADQDCEAAFMSWAQQQGKPEP